VYVGTDALTGKQLRLKPTVKTERQAQAELGKPPERPRPGGSPGELEAAARALPDCGAGEIVVKDGANGAWAVSPDGTYQCPSHRMRVLDPAGAGDAFTTGYLSAVLDGVIPAGQGLVR
jgi:sugar/nucleoside kinase (ribokinase family)